MLGFTLVTKFTIIMILLPALHSCYVSYVNTYVHTYKQSIAATIMCRELNYRHTNQWTPSVKDNGLLYSSLHRNTGSLFYLTTIVCHLTPRVETLRWEGYTLGTITALW